MFLGHFAMGVAAKPVAPKVPIWALFLAPQALDLMFLPLVAIGLEGFVQGQYGQDQINALYTHSLVGRLLLVRWSFGLEKRFGKAIFTPGYWRV